MGYGGSLVQAGPCALLGRLGPRDRVRPQRQRGPLNSVTYPKLIDAKVADFSRWILHINGITHQNRRIDTFRWRGYPSCSTRSDTRRRSREGLTTLSLRGFVRILLGEIRA